MGGEASLLDDRGHGEGRGDDVLLRHLHDDDDDDDDDDDEDGEDDDDDDVLVLHLHPKPGQLCVQGAASPLGLVCYQLHLEERISRKDKVEGILWIVYIL